MKKTKRFVKRIIALLVALALLPLESFEGCFVQTVKAAEVVQTEEAAQFTEVNTSDVSGNELEEPETMILSEDYKLTSDLEVYSLEINNVTLDLNGYHLTVSGDVLQSAGVVNINGGNLTVEGDYRMQTRSGEEGAYTYGKSTGLLQMNSDEDYVCINGNFLSDSASNSNGYLTAGVFEVKGDVVVNNTYSQYSFKATGSHTLLLSGEKKQIVRFGTSSQSESHLSNLEITNKSEEGVELATPVYVNEHVNDYGNNVIGGISIGAETSFADDCFEGSVYIGQDITLDDDLVIEGNLFLSAYCKLTGRMSVAGNCIQSHKGILDMNKELAEITQYNMQMIIVQRLE